MHKSRCLCQLTSVKVWAHLTHSNLTQGKMNFTEHLPNSNSAHGWGGDTQRYCLKRRASLQIEQISSMTPKKTVGRIH